MPGVGPFTGTTLGIQAASQLIRLFDRNGRGIIGKFNCMIKILIF